MKTLEPWPPSYDGIGARFVRERPLTTCCILLLVIHSGRMRVPDPPAIPRVVACCMDRDTIHIFMGLSCASFARRGSRISVGYASPLLPPGELKM